MVTDDTVAEETVQSRLQELGIKYGMTADGDGPDVWLISVRLGRPASTPFDIC